MLEVKNGLQCICIEPDICLAGPTLVFILDKVRMRILNTAFFMVPDQNLGTFVTRIALIYSGKT